jgi:hypothetical protein
MRKKGVRKPICPKFWCKCACVKRKSRLNGWDLRAQINDVRWILDPPCLSTFKWGGGGLESGAHLFNGSDQRAQINGDEDHSGPPPRLSTFKRRGGSGIGDATF